MGILPGFARWSPDGKLIAFHGDPQGRPDVLIVPAAGGEPRILTAGGPSGAYPSFFVMGGGCYSRRGLKRERTTFGRCPLPAVRRLK